VLGEAIAKLLRAVLDRRQERVEALEVGGAVFGDEEAQALVEHEADVRGDQLAFDARHKGLAEVQETKRRSPVHFLRTSHKGKWPV